MQRLPRDVSFESAVLVEPAAVVLHQPDAILLLGLIVAKEMGWNTPIALRLDRHHFAGLDGRELELSEDGVIKLSRVP